MYVSNTISIKIVDSENRHIFGTGNWGCCSDICPREYLGNFFTINCFRNMGRRQFLVFVLSLVFKKSSGGTMVLTKEEYLPLHAGGSLIVGQEQDGKPVGGNMFDPVFDPQQGFSGKLAQVELWNTVLTLSEIKKLANCEIPSLQPQNRVITWGSDSWIAVKANFTHTPIEKLCVKNQIVDQFIWPRGIDFDTFYSYCGTIGGK